MGQDRADIFLFHTGSAERLGGVIQMLLRVFLIIVVMQHADGLPVLFVFAEMPGHGAHGVADIQLVEKKMILRYHCRVYFFCSVQCQHIYPLLSFSTDYPVQKLCASSDICIVFQFSFTMAALKPNHDCIVLYHGML